MAELPEDEVEAVAQAAVTAVRAGGSASEAAEAMLPELRLIAARVRAEAVAEAMDVYELRERGVRVLGEEQCCELACNDGACESCPCCAAGWCVSGRSGAVPSRDLTPNSSYRTWIDTAAEHNPIAKLLAQIEGVAEVDSDEPAQPQPDLVQAVADERREAFTRAAGLLQTEAAFQERQAGEHEFQRDARTFAIQRLRLCERVLRDQAAGSVPVATPTEPDSTLGARLAATRARLGKSYAQVATETGLSTSTLYGAEHGMGVRMSTAAVLERWLAASPVPAEQPAPWFRETSESLAMLDDVRAEVEAVEAAAEQPEGR